MKPVPLSQYSLQLDKLQFNVSFSLFIVCLHFNVINSSKSLYTPLVQGTNETHLLVKMASLLITLTRLICAQETYMLECLFGCLLVSLSPFTICVIQRRVVVYLASFSTTYLAMGELSSEAATLM